MTKSKGPVALKEPTEDRSVATVAPLRAQLAVAEEAGDITAMKEVAAFATALQKGAQARGLGVAAENQAAEVVLRAERAIGTVIRGLPRAQTGPAKGKGGRAPGGEYVRGSTSDGTLTLYQQAVAAAGLDKNRKGAHQFQKLAELPEDDFEELLAQARAKAERIAKVDFYRAVGAVGKVEPEAVKRVKEMLADEEEETSQFAAFAKAAGDLDLSQLPDEELAEVAAIIKGLAGQYNIERQRRAVGAASD